MTNAGVLILEDEILIAEFMRDVLEDAGFQGIRLAHTGRQAIALAEAEAPRLAVVDLRLVGDMGGIEAAQVIQGRFGSRIVFASGAGEITEGIPDLQISGFLQKPFLPQQLVTIVGAALAG